MPVISVVLVVVYPPAALCPHRTENLDCHVVHYPSTFISFPVHLALVQASTHSDSPAFRLRLRIALPPSPARPPAPHSNRAVLDIDIDIALSE
ncbi:hypothetical protein DFH07DRAFT_968336 [Mycena maculata]|uniref:Uncharacterized protein n=1 Tax=Mycena maculata TaxID=230809 RepID=A0AAD7I2H1_9AGAR|nr:hypothetical protein DFH07DRAFT_968336 [Mycena maculata]